MKAIKVTLLEWVNDSYVPIECDSLSQAIAIMETDNTIVLQISDEESTGEITISTSMGRSIEVESYCN